MLPLKMFRAVTATALSLVLALSTVATVAHTAGDPDALCLTGVTAHDAAAHAFTPFAGSTDQQPDHCLACHLARQFRSTVGAITFTYPIVVPTPPPCTDPVTRLSASLASQSSPRAPPVLSSATA